jgi:hypothetical protein
MGHSSMIVRNGSIGVREFNHNFRHFSFKELQRIPREDQVAEARKFLDDKAELKRKLSKGNVVWLR